ncbi:hypothetical protein HGB07_01465 [Candidatus Roizmanbacteria bacterium]|nr:hypothetical protein [Candidatus Roizmanbacteria bacterium]
MIFLLKIYLDYAKKALIMFFVFAAIIALFLHFFSNNATNTSVSFENQILRDRQRIYANINNPEYQKTPIGKVSLQLYRTFNCAVIGEACTDNPDDGDKNRTHSLSASAVNLMLAPYQNPPASGIGWTYESLANAGFAPSTYAASGLGFTIIRPYMNIWKALRDSSYLLLVLVIVSIGFLIMFRFKINPQTVIKIENALPKIVITLIAITFSFAIAGFMIDLMYLIIALIVSILVHPDNFNDTLAYYYTANPTTTLSLLQSGQSIFNIQSLFFTIPNNLIGIVGKEFDTLLRAITGGLSVAFLTPTIAGYIPFISKLLPKLATQPAGLGFTWDTIQSAAGIGGILIFSTLSFFLGSLVFPNLIIGVLVFLTTIFLMFRIFFMLLSSYLKIVIFIVVAPLYLSLNAIPGRNTLTSWLKNLFVEIMTFPIVVGIFVLGGMITKLPAAQSNGILTPPFMIGLDPDKLSFLLGLMILFSLPELVKLSKQLLLPKPSPLPELGLGGLFGGATTGLDAGMGTFQKYATFASYTSFGSNLMSKIGVNIAGGKPTGPKKP